MAPRYSLRPNAKGRKGHQITDAPDSQVEHTSGSSIDANQEDIVITDERVDESVAVLPSPSSSHAPAEAHNSPTPPQDLGEQRLEDWRRRGVMSSTVTKTEVGSTMYRVEGPPRSWNDIQTSRQRVEAKRRAEAPRIAQEQQRRIYDASVQLLEKRIGALHQERDVEVERVRQKWERALPRALERGEIVLEEDEEEEEEVGVVVVERPVTAKNCRREDSLDYPPTETSSMAGDGDKDEEDGDDAMNEDEDNEDGWRSQGSPCPSSWSRPGMEFPPPVGLVTRQPLRRQPAQLLAIP
ncbi:hypothetical protein BJV74DRAFT_954428 [Russula compacta]|nr:hypothetical protein BJV74DRAFT_954428 [Russula compacta]